MKLEKQENNSIEILQKNIRFIQKVVLAEYNLISSVMETQELTLEAIISMKQKLPTVSKSWTSVAISKQRVQQLKKYSIQRVNNNSIVISHQLKEISVKNVHIRVTVSDLYALRGLISTAYFRKNCYI